MNVENVKQKGAAKNQRLVVLLMLLVFNATAVLCLPGLAPEGCRSWGTLAVCIGRIPRHELVQAVAWGLVFLFSGPIMYALNRRRG